jgi:1-pyrroline-5-carboxylate dehydrogenase
MVVKVTYSTMSADNEELQALYDAGVEKARAMLGQDQPLFVNGEERFTDERSEERSPIDDTIVVARFSQGSAADVDDAVAAAEAYQPEWAALDWRERVALLRKAGDVLEDRQFEMAALIAFEVGKNRLEALGDVAETVEFFRYHTAQMEINDGYVRPLGRLSESETNTSVMRPHGVWGVISPFNFPFALAAGPVIAALVTGNTAVLKPSNVGAMGGLELYRVMRDAGIPAAAFHVVTGSGRVVGDALVRHPDVDGFTFTGSYDVGMSIYHGFSTRIPKPVLAEMGGKNPAIVTATADLDAAADGVLRGAFGFQGQKCSATARVYVERPVYDAFIDKLVDKTSRLKVGDPIDRDVFMGPVIDRQAVERFRESVAEVAASGGTVLAGGSVIEQGDLGRGNFVEPTVVSAPMGSWVWTRELFMPFVVVGPVDSLDEAIDRANDTEYGLTAGIFAGEQSEIDRFFDRIEAGVTYVNRRAGATTGAWPGIQSFGGWKGSGTTGTGFSPWYVRQYLREQSRTVVE